MLTTFTATKHGSPLAAISGALLLLLVLTPLLAGGCLGRGNSTKGRIRIDGSSTVFPITEAVAEEFQKQNPGIRVLVGISGTGGGFEKFSGGEIEIVNASRAIKDEEEAKAADKGIESVRLTIAFDGLSIAVNRENDFVDSLTTEELRKLWEPESKISRWRQLQTKWPDQEIILFGPGTDSGTFDYFTETIVGEEDASRSDYTASEDDNVLVEGVANERNGLGYFGFAYYSENRDKLKVVPIDGGHGPVAPSESTIRSGQYSPLSRPLYIYVSKQALEKQEIEDFVRFFLANAGDLVSDVGYVPIPESEAEEQLKMLDQL